MKKTYFPPRIVMEAFDVTEHTSSCSAVKINFASSGCVLADGDSTPGMMDLAIYGGFLNTDNCDFAVLDPNPETPGNDGICYHTSAAMAFTS